MDTTFDQPSALELDRRALDLLSADVAALTDDDLSLPTPCPGWNIGQLLVHMNTEHAAICGATPDDKADPRVQFISIVWLWLDFFAETGETVAVSKVGGYVPTEMVLATHFVDMLIHRWDLAVALRKRPGTPATLLAAARPIADVITAAGSPLVGTAYKPELQEDLADTDERSLVRKFGRDPDWHPPRST